MTGVRRLRADRGAGGFDEVARVAHRLSVLLEAGLGTVSAWEHAARAAARAIEPAAGVERVGSGPTRADSVRTGAVGNGSAVGRRIRTRVRRDRADTGATARVVAEVAADLADGHAAPEAIRMALPPPGDPDRPPWATLLAAWRVAAAAGAPLAPTLARVAGVLRGLADGGREIDTALAGPVATTRIVVALPLVGLALGLAMGFDVVGTLVGTPAGLVCVAVGGILLGAAALWTRRMVASARRRDPTPGLALDLIAVAVSGGGSLDRAVADVDAALVSAQLDGVGAAARSIVAFSRDAGVPAGALLRAEAEEQRRSADAEGRRRAAQLGVRLMLPLGVCVLPAFLTLGVIPIMLSLLTSTLGEL